MSHEAKQTAGQMAKWTAITTLLVILFTKAIGAGEILQEIKGLRVDLNGVKAEVSEVKDMIEVNRKEREAALKELSAEQRKLERRVEILEHYDSVRTPRGIQR